MFLKEDVLPSFNVMNNLFLSTEGPCYVLQLLIQGRNFQFIIETHILSRPHVKKTTDGKRDDFKQGVVAETVVMSLIYI